MHVITRARHRPENSAPWSLCPGIKPWLSPPEAPLGSHDFLPHPSPASPSLHSTPNPRSPWIQRGSSGHESPPSGMLEGPRLPTAGSCPGSVLHFIPPPSGPGLLDTLPHNRSELPPRVPDPPRWPCESKLQKTEDLVSQNIFELSTCISSLENF